MWLKEHGASSSLPTQHGPGQLLITLNLGDGARAFA